MRSFAVVEKLGNIAAVPENPSNSASALENSIVFSLSYISAALPLSHPPNPHTAIFPKDRPPIIPNASVNMYPNTIFCSILLFASTAIMSPIDLDPRGGGFILANGALDRGHGTQFLIPSFIPSYPSTNVSVGAPAAAATPIATSTATTAPASSTPSVTSGSTVGFLFSESRGHS